MRKKNRLVHGVGINDADYNVCIYEKADGKSKLIEVCPYYSYWRRMLGRCYSKVWLEKYPTYKGCSVRNEWLTFSNFKSWMEQQNWEGRQLDKDFLVEGNKVYSPSTCVFLPQKVNKFITASGKTRGDYPLGVWSKKEHKKNPYEAGCSDGSGVLSYLGLFPTPLKAHQAWLVKKLEVCNEYLEEFKDEPFIKGLLRIRDKIQHHIETNTELTSF